MNKQKKIKVLFVCMGNICRSPTAHGIFEKKVEEEGLSHLIEVDSAGTHAYHIGKQPDRRSQQVALTHGLDLSHLKGRQVNIADFDYYDYILAMDNDNYHDLLQLCEGENCNKVHLFLKYAENIHIDEVPDPYFGGDKGFDNVYDMIVQASNGLFDEITQ